MEKRKINVAHHKKRKLIGIAKSIDRGQPVQSAQADHGRNFSLLADFLCIKWQIFCGLSDISNVLNSHFEIMQLYQLVLALFLFLLFHLGVPFSREGSQTFLCQQ